MLRYCTNCEKETDFPVSDFTGNKELICPVCGQVIDRNSRRPVDTSGTDRTESAIGRILSGLMHFAYIFYMCLAVIGFIAFFLKLNTVLYVVTGIAAGVYLIQLLTHTATFASGVVLVPLGAIAGYLLGGLTGMCLGIHIVFFARHIIRDVIYRLFFRLISGGR